MVKKLEMCMWQIFLCTRFTKWRSVRDKKYPETWNYLPNPEFSTGYKYPLLFKIGSAVQALFQFLTIIKNFQAILYQFYTDIICLFSIVNQLSEISWRITQLKCDVFVFIFFVDFVFIFSLTDCCGAKVTQNEKWRPFGGRWRNLKTDSIFKRRKRSWIM